LALQKTEQGITQYRGFVRNTNLVGDLQADMLMMRMNVLNYFSTKSDEQIKQYEHYLSEMQTFLQDAKRDIQQPEQAALISDIDAMIVNYKNAFSKVIGLTKTIDDITETQLVPSGNKMITTIDDINESAFSTNQNEIMHHANQAQKDMLAGRLYVAKFLQSHNDNDFNVAVGYMDKALNEQIGELAEHLPSNELSEFTAAHKNYIQAMYRIHDLIKEKNTIESKTLRTVGLQVAENVKEIKRFIMQEQSSLGAELKANTDRSIKISAILSILAIALGVIAAYLLTMSITRPIHKAVDAANQLAEGDLTVNVGNTSKDETGLLLNAVQNTATNLKEMISTISSASNELASASEELAVVTEQTSEGIAQQETETEMVATAMNEMATTVHDVADNAAKAADAANQADKEALSGSQVVEHTITSINSLSESVNHSSEKLSEVQQEVINISTILEVIKEIADQTNLLALNAAIEAARAGEQGRGFAVVADEVRSLAARTQGSTSEIQTIIEQLQAGTQSTVEVMQQGKAEADNCVEQASNTGAALNAITSAISVINDMNIQIASASEQQSSVAESINENVINVKRIAEENSVAANQTRSSSTEIAKLADQLHQLVTQFKV
jgi:methyl-accepting chemotaxis protein